MYWRLAQALHRMSSLKSNTAANLAGTALVAVTYLLILPVYLKLLGADAFGVVGLFFSLAAMCAVFDFGLGASLNRHMAQLSAFEGNVEQQRVALRTYEVVIWSICASLGFAFFFLAPSLVDHWLQMGSLNKLEVKAGFRWMALTLALQTVMSLYTHALWGLQRQIIFNVINTAMIALRLVGAAIVLLYTHADLTSFFMWQAFVTVLHVAGLACACWRLLPGNVAPKFDCSVLNRSKVFIAEVALATLFATLLMHIDKIVLSKLIGLREYGYYMLAWSIASVLGRVAGPIYSAWQPRLTQHVASGDVYQLKNTYLRGLKLLAAIVVPGALILAIFSEWILSAYTGNSELASSAMIALVLLSFGSAFNGMLLMPHAAALAHGWTRLSLIQNACACVVVVPLVYAATQRWGLDGAGIGWLLVNASLLAITLPMIQRRCMTIPMSK